MKNIVKQFRSYWVRDASFVALFFMLFFTLFILPAVIGNTAGGVLLLDIMLLVLFFTGIWSAQKRGLIFLSATLFIIHLILKMIRYADIPHQYEVEERVVACLNLLVFAFINFRLLFRDGKVNFERIVGAVNVYLLVALLGAFIYELLAEYTGEQVLAGNLLLTGTASDYTHYAYFSLVSLTTVGFGDIYPASQASRLVSVLLSTVGILYPAVVIARLVSAPPLKDEIRGGTNLEE